MTDLVNGELSEFVILESRVRESVAALLDRDTHQHFIAYLYLRRLAGSAPIGAGVKPHWQELGEVLRVPDGPAGKPYLRPFWKGTRNAAQEWLNPNLQGSYAPSSLRSSLSDIAISDAAGLFHLAPEHAAKAREVLLLGEPQPAVALAAFLYRDFAFISAHEPSTTDLVNVFRRDYGYTENAEDEFQLLYSEEWQGQPGPWFEPRE